MTYLCNMGKKITHEEYERMLYQHNSNILLLSEFRGYAYKVKVRDEIGIEYFVNSRSLLQNKQPHISKAIDKTQAFNMKLYQIFPSLKLYEEYTKGNTKTKVIDDLGIVYLVKPESLLQGRFPSIVTALDKNKAFKIKSELVHGSKYDYSNVVYKGDKTKVKIICPDHGEFWQKPNTHISQQSGCPVCNKSRGWSKSEWLTFTENRMCRFYIIECFSKNERFIKFGITSTTIDKRFQSIREMPYEYEILLDIQLSGEDSWNKELEYLKNFKEHIYKPSLKFKGVTECFNINIKNNLYE